METKEWDFGSMQAKFKIENGQLTWKLIGNGGSSYPMNTVQGIQYEKGPFMAIMSHVVVLALGGDNRRIQVPKSDKSEKLVQEINAFIVGYHEQMRRQTQPAPAPIASAGSVADELTKLANLKAQGILTEEEFQQQKQKLLNR